MMNLSDCLMFISKFTSCDGLKYHKIRYKSRRNNPIKPFQFQFTCVQPAFVGISYFFYKQIMASGNVPVQRSEAVVRGDGKCFHDDIALWRDEMSDVEHEETRRLSSALMEKKKSEGFSAATLLFELCEGTC